MTKKYFWTFCVAVSLLFFSCKYEKPHLRPKEMEKILLDINLAESYSTLIKDSLHKNIGIKNVDTLMVFYHDIFDHYHITPEEFTRSFDWYKAHPEELDSVYAKMVLKVVSMDNRLRK